MVFVPFWSQNGYRLCLFWSEFGYGFRGNKYLLFQFQMKTMIKKERVISEFDMAFCWLSNLSNDSGNYNILFAYARSENDYMDFS